LEFFPEPNLAALVNGDWWGWEGRDLKTTTGAEATISLALASAIALDSGVEDEEEAIPICGSFRLAPYL
jgi:hypothetical protein